MEHSLLSELRTIVARALSGLDMFAGSGLSELDLLPSESAVDLLQVCKVLDAGHAWTLFLVMGSILGPCNPKSQAIC